MTDKVQLIKQKIEKLIERAQAERVLHPKTILSAKNLLLVEDYNKLLQFIDSLPEEFANVEENDCTTCINDKGCVTCENGELYESAMRNDKYSCISEKPASEDRINECPHWEKYWGCETSPMNNCNSCPQAKWVEVKEEKKATVNDIRELPKQNNSKKSYCDKSLVKEEPASEDLKKEISKWRNHYISVLENNLRIDLRDIEVTANHFAEWQKQKMYKLLVEQITLNYNSGYEKGLRDKEEEMLRDAIDFFYMQINSGDMEVKNIKVFIEQFTKYIKKED